MLFGAALVVAGLGAWWLADGADSDAIAESPQEALSASDNEAEHGIDGYVIDRSTGVALVGATVTLSCGDDPPQPQAVDETGGFAFLSQDLPDTDGASCTVAAAADGYVAGPGQDGQSEATIALQDGAEVYGVQLSLVRASELSGTVYLGDSKSGLADTVFTVLYLEAPGRNEPYTIDVETVSDAEGKFTIGGLGPGRVQILAEHADHAMAESEALFLKPGENQTGVVIRLASGGAVSGVVTDDQGTPLAEAKVTIYAGKQGKQRARHRATTDAEGSFKFDSVSAGAIEVSAEALGFRSAKVSTVVTVREPTTVTISLKRRAGFGGTVLDQAGKPVAGAEILSSDPQSRRRPVARSDHKGAFWVGWIPVAGSVVTARHAKYTLSAPVRSPEEGQSITLTLKAGGGLRARVLDPSGRPVAVFTAAIWPEPGTPGRGQTIRVGDASGMLEVPSLAPGVYTIRVTAADFPPAVSKPQQVVALETTDAGDIKLEGGGQLTGRVLHAETGAPLANVRVFLSGSRAAGFRGRAPTAATSAAGEFVIRGLPAGRLSLRFVRAGFVTRVESALQVAGGGDGDIGDVSMSPATGDSAGRGRMQYQGVGAVLRRTSDGLMVDRVFEGAPAGEAGLVAGTKIQTINGTSVSDLDLRRAVELIRGEAGSEVKLKVLMPGSNTPEMVHVVRGEVMTPKPKMPAGHPKPKQPQRQQ